MVVDVRSNFGEYWIVSDRVEIPKTYGSPLCFFFKTTKSFTEIFIKLVKSFALTYILYTPNFADIFKFFFVISVRINLEKTSLMRFLLARPLFSKIEIVALCSSLPTFETAMDTYRDL